MTASSRIPIKITVERLGEALGELVRFLAPKTVDAILKALPMEGKAMVWKEEVYFPISVKVGAEKEKSKAEKGTLAYWPLGNSFCIFYGDSQPYSPVNLIGKITHNIELFRLVKEGNPVKVQKTY